MALVESRVEIGFLEKTSSWKLESRFFPSKVGGKPAWLNMKDIDVDLKCGHCSKPCIFLCQLYAPWSDEPNSYHRSIFVFVCRDPNCSKPNDSKNFIVYRCQLGLKNKFYPEDDPVEKEDWCPEVRVETHTKVCRVCGCFASNQCGKCKTANYCTREHQVLDWKSGHKEKCSTDFSDSCCNILFPEYEVVNESEILDEEDLEMLKKSPEKSEEERMREYEKLVEQQKTGTLEDQDIKLLEELALGNNDKYFKVFKERLKLCDDQVIRYDKGGEPLWITKPTFKMDDVIDCEYCGSERIFEFQILPTMLNSLNVDSLEKSIDWGVLLVYSCRKSCGKGPAYKRELLLKQDII